MGGCEDNRPHLIEAHTSAALRRLPSRLATGQTASNNDNLGHAFAFAAASVSRT